MQNHLLQTFQYSDIFSPHDLAIMSTAVVVARERLIRSGQSVENEMIAKIILRFYRKGLLDHEKLADLAALYAQSKLLKERAPS